MRAIRIVPAGAEEQVRATQRARKAARIFEAFTHVFIPVVFFLSD
jgi:hypothetical protein